jgi:hypothetical protein
MSPRTALGSADLPTGVAELDRSSSAEQTLNELHHHSSSLFALAFDHQGWIDTYRISDPSLPRD